MNEAETALHNKISELERELSRLQRYAARIHVVESDIEALRRSLELLADKRQSDSIVTHQPDIFPTTDNSSEHKKKRLTVKRGSQLYRVLKIVEIAKSPIMIHAIEDELRKHGEPIAHNAISSYLSRLARFNCVKRVAENCYALSEGAANIRTTGAGDMNKSMAQELPPNGQV